MRTLGHIGVILGGAITLTSIAPAYAQSPTVPVRKGTKVACLAEGTPGATFGNMNQSICSRLKSLLAPSGINVQTYLLNLTHGQAALVASVEAGTSDPDVFMALISTSDRNPAYFESARNHPSVPHILSWMPIDPSDISAPNVVHINYRDSIVWYLKGVLAAKMSTSNNFTIMLPRMWTEYVVDTNMYYAGLKSVKPDANLVAFYTWAYQSPIYISESVAMFPDLEIIAGLYSMTSVTQEMLTKWPKLKGIENQFDVAGSQADIDLVDDPRVLTWTQYDLAPLYAELARDIHDGPRMDSPYLSLTKTRGGKPVVSLARLSKAIPGNVKYGIEKMQEALLFQGDPKYPPLYCHDSIRVLKKVYPITNGCLPEAYLLDRALNHPLHPDIQFINIAPEGSPKPGQPKPM